METMMRALLDLESDIDITNDPIDEGSLSNQIDDLAD